MTGRPDPDDDAWIARCARRMVACDRFLDLEQARGVAEALAANPALRERGPERVAEDCLRTGGRPVPAAAFAPAA